MIQCLLRRNPPPRIQNQALLQKIHETPHKPHLLFLQPHTTRHNPTPQIPCAPIAQIYPVHHDLLAQTQVALDSLDKIPEGVEVFVGESGALEELRVEAAFHLHHEQEHMSVGLPREQDLAGVELVESAADGPDVQGGIVGHAEYDLWGTVESTDEVGSDLVLACVGGTSQIT